MMIVYLIIYIIQTVLILDSFYECITPSYLVLTEERSGAKLSPCTHTLYPAQTRYLFYNVGARTNTSSNTEKTENPQFKSCTTSEKTCIVKPSYLTTVYIK